MVKDRWLCGQGEILEGILHILRFSKLLDCKQIESFEAGFKEME